jgi:hypothetical protein
MDQLVFIIEKTYYLHPELVFVGDAGRETTFLCKRCYTAKDDPAALSIAKGIDFGTIRD